MENLIEGKDVLQLVTPENKYSPEELNDIVKQLQVEKENPDSGDFIFFHGKEYKVKRATYSVIRQITLNPPFKDANAFVNYLNGNIENIIGLMDSINANNKANILNRIKFIFLWFKLFYYRSSFIGKRIENKYHKKNVSDWHKLLELTFEGDTTEMELENLIPSEVIRLRRIFFRYRVEENLENQEKQK